MSETRKNIVLIGDGYVGKTSILNAIKTHQFDEQIPNVYDEFDWPLKINGKQISIKFIDTAGQEEFALIRKFSYVDANLFLLCFAVDDLVSFENMETKWIPEMEEYISVPIILIGTKCDLRENNTKSISKETIIKFQKKIGAVFYVECSAKTLTGIEELKTKIIKVLTKERSCVIQ